MKRSEKEQVIASVKEKVVRAQGLYLADFTGVTVEEVNELRREFRKANVDYQVVKNTLTRRALESATGYDKVIEKLTGHTAIAFGYDDPITPAKIIKKFRDKHDKKLNVKACVIESQFFDGSQLDELAKLPSRNELIAGVLGSIQAPILAIVGVLDAVVRNLVSIVDAIEQQKKAA
jgi:large subunit ribosomal protein L10